jgi:pyridoxine kinase
MADQTLNILSIQSHVAYGHVGNASAVFPMQRLGVEVWPIHTVQFSNHTGYGAWKGRVFDGQMIDEVMEGVAERGVLPRCDGVLSGYVGSSDIGHAILGAVGRVREANPRATYCCDPVIGDVGRGVFVRPGVPEFFRERALPAADIVTPNQFELEFLSGLATAHLPEAGKAVAKAHALGPRVILVTSLITEETPADAIDLLVSEGGEAWRLRSPRLDVNVNGAGDAIAAVFYVQYLRTGSAAEALSRAASSIYGLLKRTQDAGSREILTVAAQDEFVTPTIRLQAEKL